MTGVYSAFSKKGNSKGVKGNAKSVIKPAATQKPKGKGKSGAKGGKEKSQDGTCWEFKTTGVCPRGGAPKCKWGHEADAATVEDAMADEMNLVNDVIGLIDDVVTGGDDDFMGNNPMGEHLDPMLEEPRLEEDDMPDDGISEDEAPRVQQKGKGKGKGRKGAAGGEGKGKKGASTQAKGAAAAGKGSGNAQTGGAKGKEVKGKEVKGKEVKGKGKDAKSKGKKGAGKVAKPPQVGPNGEAPDDPICWDFKNGTCRRGDKCKWQH